jgi:hypothetical protein
MSEREWERSEVNEAQVAVIGPVLERYRSYWPLTVRQVYYQLVKEGGAGQWMDELVAFSRTLRGALLEGMLPAVAVAEEGGELREGGAWEDATEFVHSEIETFLWGYRRDLLQGQERYVEVWVEKPGLMDPISQAAAESCVRTVCCHGLPSVTFMDALRGRLAEVKERRQSAVVLFFGDLDPRGADYTDRVQEVLRTEGNIWELELRREAVTVEDATRYALPESVYTRSKRSHGAAEPGSVPVELEALPPDVLAERVQAAIAAQLDMQMLANQRAVQSREALRLGKLRAEVMRRIRPVLRQQMPSEV